MLDEIFGDPLAGANLRAFLNALQHYVADGHPVTADTSGGSDGQPTMSFEVQRDLFDGYLRAQGLEPAGDD